MRGQRFFLPGLATLLLSLDAAAQNAAPLTTSTSVPAVVIVNMRAGVHPDFDRVVFDWPRNVKYSIQRDGTHAVIRFAAPATTRFDKSALAHLTRAHGFTTSRDKDGHLTVAFTVGAKAVLKDFVSDESVVIDVSGDRAFDDQTPAAAAQNMESKPEMKANPVPSSPPPAPVAVKPPESVAPAAPAKETAAPAKQAPLPPPVADTHLTMPNVGAPTTGPAVTPPAPSPAPATTPAVQPSAAPSPVPAPQLAPAAVAVKTPAKNPAAPTLDIGSTPLLIAAIDPHMPIRAVIYARAGYGYIVFDRKLTLDLAALTAGQSQPRLPLEPLALPKASGFRFLMPSGADIRATRDGTVWQIFVTRQEPDVPVSTSLVAQPDFALGARFLLPLPDAPDIIHLTDPVVGDDLILIPLEQTQAFSVGRRMSELMILPAAQGLVIKPLTDKIIVREVSDGIEVTTDGGLRLSSSHDTGASQQSDQKAKAAAAGKSMFDFAAWRGKPGETFTQTRQRLQQTIVDVPDVERNRARLELARFYFAHGMGAEASALLSYLAKLVPDLTAHADFRALSGAAKILSYRAEEGLKDLDLQQLNGQPEIDLWQAVADGELRNWKDAEEKFSATESMLGGYPEPFYSRFSVLAVECALAADKDHEAADWLDRLEAGPHREEINPAIEYLHGVLHAKSGQSAAAEDAWKNVAASNDRLYKIRAEMALIDLRVSNNSLTPAQAADRMESMRFGWRGDDLEVDILHRLGQFYVQAKNVKAGLNVMAQAVQLYPNSPLVPDIKSEMSQIFHDVFLGDLGKNLPALDALTLYQQYRNLMPTGKDGDATIRNLAERLVAIDLLDQAATLLEDLVKSRLQGEEKGHVSVRLAAIRLLDHNPDAALAALDLANADNYPPGLQNERLLLRAKALSGLHRDDEALALLHDNSSQPAKILRADITMHAQRWTDAAKALLDLVGPPPAAGTVLTNDQADWLVNTAIALSLADDMTGLDKLAIDYGAAMSAMPQNDTFRVLTTPQRSSQLRDISGVQSRITDVDMFQGFLDSYRNSDPDLAKDAAKKP